MRTTLLMLWLSKLVIRALAFADRNSRRPKHISTGKRGEMEAYFHLRSLGYRIIAANVRLPLDRGEIDLIGWDNATLCFIEVKTRSVAEFAPPSAAVDRDKKRHIRSVARRYVQRLKAAHQPHCRFDIVSIIIPPDGNKPEITLQKGAFSWQAARPQGRRQRDWRAANTWRGPRK